MHPWEGKKQQQQKPFTMLGLRYPTRNSKLSWGYETNQKNMFRSPQNKVGLGK
jgi:hypothetical protein